MAQEHLGRIYEPDERDKRYPLRDAIPSGYEYQTYKYWWDQALWGDQGRTPECVSYAWLHWLEDGPTTHFYKNRNFDPAYLNEQAKEKHQPLFEHHQVYKEAQNRDRWDGNSYQGTSVRAGAKVLKDRGVIKEYRWASNLQDVVDSVLNLGPVVVGTVWYKDMFYPDSKGFIKPTGDQVGGHAYVLNGVNVTKKYFRIKNSWSRRWGKNGHAYITFDDFEKLMNEYGEACMAFEKHLDDKEYKYEDS